jgi:hypothetical protein
MITKFTAIVFAMFLPLGAALVGETENRRMGETESPLSDSGFDHSHALYGKVLDAFVADGWVDYAGLQRDPADLNAYLDRLASVSSEEFTGWSEPERLAFLINLYNAATLELIIDHYPVKSIKKIWPPWKSPWKQEVVRLFGEKVTLDHVEHGLIRKNYKEPRIHFALVCAAISCPPLRKEPYTPERLDEQLTDEGRNFLNTPDKNRVDLANRTAYLSKIFKWFSGDFEENAGSILAFVRPYFPEEISKKIDEGTFRVEYLDYDWALNDRKAKQS